MGKAVALPVCGDGIITSPEVCDLDEQPCTTDAGKAGRQWCSADCTQYAACVAIGQSSCVDTDGGENYITTAIVYGNLPDGRAYTLTDVCTPDGIQLAERYCVGISPALQFYTCAYGCAGGKCTAKGSCENRICEREETPVSCPTDCSICGDGLITDSELCDGNARSCKMPSGTPGQMYCSADCTAFGPCQVCGDGIISGAEQCDDGNTIDGDGCSSTCVAEKPVCGDGVCDAGESSASCPSDCPVTPICGNGIVEPPEVCDRNRKFCTISDYAGTQSCSVDCSGFNACATTERCGDGITNGPEQCDDGNTISGDGCSSACMTESLCGNGICDAGESPSSCLADCPIPSLCGNAIVESGEACDPPGSTAACPSGESGTSTCSADCRSWISACMPTPICGNGVIEGTEVCDGSTQLCVTPAGLAGTQQCQPDCAGFAECVARCVDRDADGFGIGCAAGLDCDDANNRINPRAFEILGNSIDDNCNSQVDEECRTDANGNGKVDILDLVGVGRRFGSSDPRYDLDGDAQIGLTDLILVARRLGMVCVVM